MFTHFIHPFIACLSITYLQRMLYLFLNMFMKQKISYISPFSSKYIQHKLIQFSKQIIFPLKNNELHHSNSDIISSFLCTSFLIFFFKNKKQERLHQNKKVNRCILQILVSVILIISNIVVFMSYSISFKLHVSYTCI